nr:DUF6063 family protein [Candidatus Sigynarchaeum springense]
MDVDVGDLERAARLIYLGLDTRQVPVGDLEYRDLVKKYKVEGKFQQLVRHVATGLNLKVLDVDDFGIVLCPNPDCLFAFKLSDIKAKPEREERVVWAVIILGIAAYFYPKRKSFLEGPAESLKTATVVEIDEFIRAKCQLMIKAHGKVDAPVGTPEKTTIYQVYVNLPQVDGMIEKSRSTSLYYVRQVFEFLVKQGLVGKREEEDTYTIYDKFKLLISELATNDAFIEFIQENYGDVEVAADL